MPTYGCSNLHGAVREANCCRCALLDRMGMGYFFLDGEWLLENANNEFAVMHGFSSRDAVLGKSFFALLEEEDLLKAKRCRKRLQTSGVVSTVFTRINHDGKPLHHMAMMTPLKSQGDTPGTQGIMIDVTQQKLREDRMRLHLTELAQVQRVNVMGKMVSELAHEIAQPLYAITNYAEACAHVVQESESLESEMLMPWMNGVTEQAGRAAAVVRRLRSFIHKSKSERVEVDLNERIENVINLVESVAREHRVEIEFHAGEALPRISADPIQIDQVLVNLIQNSVEAMADTPKRERRIIIETSRESDNTIRAAVRDMGRGIDEKDLNKVFDAFYSTKEDGLGIGLAISRSIIIDHGGRLWPTHNLHRGTTFHFSLPIADGG